MKTLRLFVSILTMTFTLCTWAYDDFKKDEICYKILSYEDKTVEVAYNPLKSYAVSLVIPDEVNGYTVVRIGESAFFNYEVLASISIPNGVTTIGRYAFRNCKKLTSISIPNSVTSIGEYAFSGCGLTSISIPNSVTSIGEHAFGGCRLTSLTIPCNVSYIGKDAFWRCGLTSIVVDKDNKVYDSRDNCNALIYTATDSIIKGCNSTIIPNGIKKIGECAFSECNGIESIVIPNSVTTIGESAFDGCKNMSSVVLSENLVNIGDWSFCGCINLASISIPNGVTSIGEDAFSGCGLTSITIPCNVSYIGKDAFWGCGLTSIVVDKDNKVYDSRNNCNAIIETATDSLIFGCSSTIIPDGVKIIGEDALYECKDLGTVVIPGSVTSISDYAFYKCEGLTSVVFSDGVANIGAFAFFKCTCLTSLEIPKSVINVGDNAFYGCSNLKTIVIPNSEINIGKRAFSGCKKLTDVYNYSEIPQIIKSNTFSIREATLHVIKGKKEAFAQAEGWNEFTIIDDLEPDVPVSVSKITCEDNKDAKIYSLDGRATDGNSLKKGVYIKNGKKFLSTKN